ncbi:MAG TPA: hypothetical protein VK427_18430, partial [Kofleriaceae bacterium]|nr:hypothetical protein [Kofleriaceae bacterium]
MNINLLGGLQPAAPKLAVATPAAAKPAFAVPEPAAQSAPQAEAGALAAADRAAAQPAFQQALQTFAAQLAGQTEVAPAEAGLEPTRPPGVEVASDDDELALVLPADGVPFMVRFAPTTPMTDDALVDAVTAMQRDPMAALDKLEGEEQGEVLGETAAEATDGVALRQVDAPLAPAPEKAVAKLTAPAPLADPELAQPQPTSHAHIVLDDSEERIVLTVAVRGNEVH